MGGKKSKAPKAPDYAKAATAQGAADKATAQYTTAVDRPNQEDPYGQSKWTFTGSDINNPKPGDWKQTTYLNKPQQDIFNVNQMNDYKGSLYQGNAMDRANWLIANPHQYSVSPFKQAQGMQEERVGLPGLRGAQVGVPQFGVDRVGLAQYNQMLNAPGMGADRVGLAQYNQMLNAPGMGADRIGVAGNTLQGLQDVNESADQFGVQGQQVRDALYGKMTQFSDERFNKAEQQERTRLAQMGLQEGSKAYTNALSEFNRSKDESYQTAQLNAILAGGQEQSRMIGDRLASRQSNIGLRQGQFGQNMARDQQDMAERLQNYQASANQYGQNQGERQFGFQAGMARDQQDMAERLQNYQASANQYGQNQGERQFGFNANMQRDQMDLTERLASFDAGAQRFGMDHSQRMDEFGANASRYGMDQSERQARATNELNLAQQRAAQRQQEFSEGAWKRNNLANEASMVLGGMGNMQQMPQFSPFAPSTPFNAPDMLGAANAQYGAAMNQYNAGRSQKGGMMGAGAGMMGSLMGGK